MIFGGWSAVGRREGWWVVCEKKKRGTGEVGVPLLLAPWENVLEPSGGNESFLIWANSSSVGSLREFWASASEIPVT